MNTLGYPRSPSFVVHGAETTAPNAGTILATWSAPTATPLIEYSFLVTVSFNADDSLPTYEIAHRNAANTADLEVTYVPASAAPGLWQTIMGLGVGERLVVRNKTIGTSGKIYQVDLYGWGQ